MNIIVKGPGGPQGATFAALDAKKLRDFLNEIYPKQPTYAISWTGGTCYEVKKARGFYYEKVATFTSEADAKEYIELKKGQSV